MKEPIHVSDENFEKAVLKSAVPVVVDFWAPCAGRAAWWPPCWRRSPASMRTN